ncbi:DNA cytosine methyltransferase [Terasakiella pusilla]|uniref:DNA cytosine methyltransferase n=1 Tax=Terasakiella pusilla TaxID=64973 RepID=UPI003AA85D68
MAYVNVKEATAYLQEQGLVKGIEGTRRFIRKGDILAEKASNHDGYQIDFDALKAFVWVKTASHGDIVQRLMEAEQKTVQPKAVNEYRVASFFAGIGGFDLGCERAGMEVVFQCEINSFCQKVLKKHWPDTPLHGDITKLTAPEIPEANVWCGGFPCQDVSLANQGKRKGLKGERSGLFYKYAELVDARKPEWLVLENVPGLLNSHGGEDFRILLQTLDELGYGVSWRVLDAKYFGTPQRRRRVYIVASRGSLRSAGVLFEPGATSITDKQGRGERSATSEGLGGKLQEANLYSIQHASIGRKHTAGPQAKGYRSDGETYTLDSRGSTDAVCAPNDGFRVRRTSGVSKELDSNRVRAAGNAVAVPIVEWVAKRIIQVDKGEIS